VPPKKKRGIRGEIERGEIGEREGMGGNCAGSLVKLRAADQGFGVQRKVR